MKIRLLSTQCQVSLDAMLKTNPERSPGHRVEDFVIENFMDRILDIREDLRQPELTESQREHILTFWRNEE